MSKVWYEIKNSISKKINENRNSNNLKDVCFIDYINWYNKFPEDFNEEKRKELIAIAIVHCIYIMGISKTENKEAIFTDCIKHFNIKMYSYNTIIKDRYHLLSNGEYLNQSEISSYVVKKIDNAFNILESVKKMPEYKTVINDFPEELFFKYKCPSNLRDEVCIKNGLIKLEKEFPKFKDGIAQVKKEFFKEVLKTIGQKVSFNTESELSKAVSFLNQEYDEKVMEMVNKYVLSTAKYSYLKHKPTITKLIKVHPSSTKIFENFMNLKGDLKEGEVFVENDKVEYRNIEINLEVLEAKFWGKQGLKRSKFELKDLIMKFCEYSKNNNLYSPFSMYAASEYMPREINKLNIIFKIVESNNFNMSINKIETFIKNTLIDYISLNLTEPKSYMIEEKFNVYAMSNDITKGESALKKNIKKF